MFWDLCDIYHRCSWNLLCIFQRSILLCADILNRVGLLILNYFVSLWLWSLIFILKHSAKVRQKRLGRWVIILWKLFMLWSKLVDDCFLLLFDNRLGKVLSFWSFSRNIDSKYHSLLILLYKPIPLILYLDYFYGEYIELGIPVYLFVRIWFD